MCLVYIHRKKTDNKIFYIGISKNQNRAYSKYKRNLHWHNIVNKHDYYVEIILENLTWQEACEAEIYLISKFGRENLANKTDGGEGVVGNKLNKHSKKKIGKFHKGKKLSEDHKNKLRQGHKNMSKESRQKMSEANKNKIPWNKGKQLSEQHKNNLSKLHTGSVWVNNGIIEKFVKPENIPKGFVRGRKNKEILVELKNNL